MEGGDPPERGEKMMMNPHSQRPDSETRQGESELMQPTRQAAERGGPYKGAEAARKPAPADYQSA